MVAKGLHTRAKLVLAHAQCAFLKKIGQGRVICVYYGFKFSLTGDLALFWSDDGLWKSIGCGTGTLQLRASVIFLILVSLIFYKSKMGRWTR